MNEFSKINWFPGHMLKATKNINESVKNADLIIEVLDARAIKISSIIDQLNLQKPILKVALKLDLADINPQTHPDIVFGSVLNTKFRSQLMKIINQKISSLYAKAKTKGLVNPTFYIMIVGLPNTGKSSLINFLLKKNVLVTKNMAGVTRNQSVSKINDTLYIQDNPGVMFKNIADIETGYKLALINCVKKEVLPIEAVSEYGYYFYQKHYAKALFNKYQLPNELAFNQFIEELAKKNNFLIANNKLDYDRCINYFFNDCINNKICKVNYDK